MGCDGLRMAHGLAVPADRVLQDQSALSSPRELVLGSQSTPGADAASRARGSRASTAQVCWCYCQAAFRLGAPPCMRTALGTLAEGRQ